MVTSRRQDVIKREIDMLTCMDNDRRVLQPEERLYLLALGYFKTKDYATSQLLLEQCLQIAPGWEKAMSLKTIVDERVVHHGLIGIGIAAFASGLFVGGLAAFVRDFAATLAKKN
ncbi:Mitochondrial fission 1 protein A [Trifolium repens]|nr:Mitochondrial fission 1 protein A [Trifolium repens]